MGRVDHTLEAVYALAGVAELPTMSPEVRVQAVETLGKHWPEARRALRRIARSGTVAAVTAAARKALSDHGSH